MPIAIPKLKSQLLTSGLQQKDPVLYQLMIGIIDNLLRTQITANSNGGTTINEFSSILSLFDLSSSDSDEGMGIPGPQGLIGNTGPDGPMGAIIFPPDSEDGDIFPPIVGPQGNPGPTGSQGPVGAFFPVEDGLDGEDGFPGIRGTDGASGGGDVLRAEFDLDDTEIKSLNTVPIEVIPAQGVETLILIHGLYSFKDTTAGAYSASANISLRYDGLGTDLTTAASYTLNSLTKGSIRSAIPQLSITNAPTNTGVVIRSAGNITGGNAANYIKGHIIYTVLSGVS